MDPDKVPGRYYLFRKWYEFQRYRTPGRDYLYLHPDQRRRLHIRLIRQCGDQCDTVFSISSCRGHDYTTWLQRGHRQCGFRRLAGNRKLDIDALSRRNILFGKRYQLYGEQPACRCYLHIHRNQCRRMCFRRFGWRSCQQPSFFTVRSDSRHNITAYMSVGFR